MCLSTPPLLRLIVKGGEIMRDKKEINIQIGEQVKLAREQAKLTQCCGQALL